MNLATANNNFSTVSMNARPCTEGHVKMDSSTHAQTGASMPSRNYRAIPKRHEHVMVKIDSHAESGVYARMPDFADRLCFAPWSELSKSSRVKSFAKLAPIGSTRVLRVARVDKEKGYVDVSARDISKAHEQEAKDVHLKNNIVFGIINDLAKLIQVPVPELYLILVNPLWVATRRAHLARKAARKATRAAVLSAKKNSSLPLRTACAGAHDSDSEYQDELVSGLNGPGGKASATRANAASDSSSSSSSSDEDEHFAAGGAGDDSLYGTWRHPLDVLRTILVQPDAAWRLAFGSDSTPPKPMRAALTQILSRTVPPPIMTVKAVVSAVCFGPEGIDGLKAMLLAGKHALKSEPPLGAAPVKAAQPHVHIRLLKSPGGAGSLFSIQLPQVATKDVGMNAMDRVLSAVKDASAKISGAKVELVNAPALVIDKAGGKLNIKTLTALQQADSRSTILNT